MITVPELQQASTLLDTDLVVITHANGQSEKMTGATLKSVISENFQPKELETPLTIAGNEKETVEDALDAINKAVSNLPTDPVLHYSFDEVPDYPDGAADVRLLDNNTYDLQSTNFKFTNNGGAVFSNNNGNLQVAITGSSGSTGVFINNNSINNKLLKFKIQVSDVTGNLQIRQGFGSGSMLLRGIVKEGTYEISYYHSNNLSYPALYFICETDSACTFTVEQIYIGAGSYFTPIINNINGQNNAVNNGGIATKGVSGKGAYFLNGKYADIGTDFQLSPDFTISIWVKPDNNTNNLLGNIVRKGSVLVLRNGNSSYPNLTLNLYGANTQFIANYELSPLLTPNQWSNLILAREGTSLKFYLNGELLKTITLTNNTIATNNQPFTIGGYTDSPNDRSQSIDDLLIFDRALSESEVLALYQNRGNTPKHYTLADYQLKQKLPAVPSTDGTYSLKCTVASGTPTYSWVAES